MTIAVGKFRLLVEKLYQRTLEGILEWNYESSIQYLWTSVAGKVIEIDKSQNENGEPLITIIIKGDGNVIERFSDETIRGSTPSVGNYDSYYLLMEDFYDIAKRKALGVDKSLDEILKELDDYPF